MADRYISPDGDDTTGDGTALLPWRNFQKAHDSSTAGDTVNVATGSYDEATFLSITKSIYYVGDGGACVLTGGTTNATILINGASANGIGFTGITVDGETDTTALVTADLADGVAFTNCTFQNAKTGATPMIKGQGLANESKNWTFNGCKFIGSGSHGIQCAGHENLTITNCDFTGSWNILLFNASTQEGAFAFTNNRLTDLAMANDVLAMTSSAAMTEATVTGNIISIASFVATVIEIISINNTPIVTVSDNVIDASALATSKKANHILINSTGTAMGKVIVDSNTLNDKSSEGNAILVGFDVASAGDGLLDGFHIINNTIYQSRFYGEAPAQRHGIEAGFSAGEVSGNYVEGAYWNYVMKGGTATVSKDWTGYKGMNGNISVTSNNTAMINVKGVSNINVCNTLCINKGSETLSGGMIYIIENALESAGTIPVGVTLKNNIYYQENGACSAVYTGHATTAATLTIDNSVMYSGNGSGFSCTITGEANSPYTSLATWKSDGYDATFGVESDPSFVDLIDYELSPDSPCIGVGAKTWAGANPVGRNGEPFADFGTDIGANQSTHNPFHPVNL